MEAVEPQSPKLPHTHGHQTEFTFNHAGRFVLLSTTSSVSNTDIITFHIMANTLAHCGLLTPPADKKKGVSVDG